MVGREAFVRELQLRYKRMFGADSARIQFGRGRCWLYVGTNKHTSHDSLVCWRDGNGRPVNWNYVEERIVAYGRNFEAMAKDAFLTFMLERMSQDEYMARALAGTLPSPSDLDEIEVFC